MMTLIFAIALATPLLICAYARVGLLAWTGATAGVLLAFTVFGQPAWWLLIVSWLIFLPAAAVLNWLPWRRRLISAPLADKFAGMVPRLSQTEQIALDAGTVGWEGEMFTGRPDWKRFIDDPLTELTAEEQAFLDGPVEELCDMIDDWEITHNHASLPEPIWDFLRTRGFFSMIIPKQYGGLEFSALAHRAVLQKISGVSAVVGSTVAVPNSLGPAELLLHYGTDEQKDHYLPRLAKGEEIPCFALTGPTAGSDATSIPDYGVVCKGQWQGREVLGMRLNFDKRYITLAPVATLVGLAFRLYDPDGLIGDKQDIGISVALLPAKTPGLEIGRRHLPLNNPFSNGPIRGKDVFVPLEVLLGGLEYAGQGWRMLVESLSVGRAISLPSNTTGGAKMGALATGAYARIRKQFNMPIGHFEGVEEALARIAGRTYAISALSRATATAVDKGEKPAVAGAIGKYYCTEWARQVARDVMDIHGGKGIMLGPKNYVGRGWQIAPVAITVEGANILTRTMMLFGQGAIRCHPYILSELEALQLDDPDQRVNEFDRLLFGHIGHSISCAVRSLLLGMSFARFAPVPGDRKCRKYYRKITRYSAAFAFLADVALLTYGGKLKMKEKISGRLGDALSHLYIGSAILKRFEHEKRPAADQPIMAWAFHDGIFNIQEALRGVIDNYPIAMLRPVLRRIIFPLGLRERRPNDRLGHKVAQLLLSPSETRDRLTRGSYRSDRSGHPVGVMEKLLPDAIAAEPLERKLIKAVRSREVTGYTFAEQVRQAAEKSVLTQCEAELLLDVRARVMDVIAVDDFELAELQAGIKARDETHRAAA